MNRFKKYLSSEIGIEFKACLYFFAILFFYSVYQLIQGSCYASIAVMAEMIVTTYFMGYIQVYLLWNFDEAEQFGIREGAATLVCSVLYVGLSFLLQWFDRNTTATVLYFFWMLLCYVCAFLVYKIKRDIDTAMLNQKLDEFKKAKKKTQEK